MKFSIIISVFNREKEIVRCLKSCLSQDYKDYEIIVVDDGSTDNTVKTIQEINDSHINLYLHSKNLGMGAALDTATQNTKGDWIVRLDSDHALFPYTLKRFHSYTQQASYDIGIIGARYLWDNGRVTPRFIPNEILDYQGRIKWVEIEGGSDYLSCIRREVFEVVHWSRRRGSVSALLQLDLAYNTHAWIIDEILAIEYTDAKNSYHRANRRQKFENRKKCAKDQAATYDEILKHHIAGLQQWGPKQYELILLKGAFNHFLAGDRHQGYILMKKYLSIHPSSLIGWGLLVSGLLGGKTLELAFLLKKAEWGL